jgi:hypothetical protein
MLGAGSGRRRGPAESETHRQNNAPITKIVRRQNNLVLLLVCFIVLVMRIILQKDARVFSPTDRPPEFQ